MAYTKNEKKLKIYLAKINEQNAKPSKCNPRRDSNSTSTNK